MDDILRGTRQVAQLLGVNPNRLSRAVWEGKLDEPVRGPGGCFCWTRADIRRASWVLLGRDLDDVTRGRELGHV